MARDSYDKECDDCHGTIRMVQTAEGWKPYQPGTTTLHWMVCPAEDARQRRIRKGLEPYTFPVSASSLDDYRDCKYFYMLRNFDRLKNLGLITPQLEAQVLSHFPDGHVALPENPAGLLGRACHSYFAVRLKGGSQDEATEAAQEEGIPVAFWRDFMIMTRSFEGQLTREMWDPRGASIEDRLNMEWKEGAITVQLQVVLDFWRLDSPHWPVVTDWKTGRAIDPEYKLRADVQAGSNVLVLKDQLPQIQGGRFQQVQFRYAAADDPPGVDFSEDDLEWIDKAIKSQVKAMIAERDWRYNPYCQYCPPGAHPTANFPVAVLEKGAVHIKMPQTIEEAEVIAEVILASAKIASAGREVLRPWVELNGPVGGFDHYPKVKRELAREWIEHAPGEGGELIEVRKLFGVERFIEILRDFGYGQELPEYIYVSGTKLKTILDSTRKHASIGQAVRDNDLIVESTGTEFEWRAPEAPEVPKPPKLEKGKEPDEGPSDLQLMLHD